MRKIIGWLKNCARAVSSALALIDINMVVDLTILATLITAVAGVYYSLAGELPEVAKIGLMVFLAAYFLALIAHAFFGRGSTSLALPPARDDQQPEWEDEHRRLMDEYIRVGAAAILRAGTLVSHTPVDHSLRGAALARALRNMGETHSLVIQAPFIWDSLDPLLDNLRGHLLNNRKILVLCEDAGSVQPTANHFRQLDQGSRKWCISTWPDEHMVSSLLMWEDTHILVTALTCKLEDTLLEYLEQVRLCVVVDASEAIAHYATRLTALCDCLRDVTGGRVQYIMLTRPGDGVESACRQITRTHCPGFPLYLPPSETTHYILWKTEGNQLSSHLSTPNRRYLDPVVALTLPSVRLRNIPVTIFDSPHTTIGESMEWLAGTLPDAPVTMVQKYTHVEAAPMQHFVAYDDTNNLAFMLANLRNRAQVSCLIHVLSERYLLRDYLAKYLEFFMDSPLYRMISFKPSSREHVSPFPYAEIASENPLLSPCVIPESQAYQNYLPGQTVKHSGRLYLVEGIDRATESRPMRIRLKNIPCEQNTTTRHAKRFTATNAREITHQTLQFPGYKISCTTFVCDLRAETIGFHNFYNGFYLADPHCAYVELPGKDREAATRVYSGPHLLRYTFECAEDIQDPAKVSMTVAALLNEVCRTLLPHSYQYLDFCVSHVTRAQLPVDKESLLIQRLYPELLIEEAGPGVSLYVALDSPESGLLDTISTRMSSHILPIVSDYLSALPELDSYFLTYGFADIPECLDIPATTALIQRVTAHSNSLTEARLAHYTRMNQVTEQGKIEVSSAPVTAPPDRTSTSLVIPGA